MSGPSLWWSDSMIAIVVRLRDAGKTNAECGDAVGRSASAVKRLFTRLKRPRGLPRGRTSPEAVFEQDGLDYFNDNHIQEDLAFQKAMEAAGYKRHVVTEPGTKHPIELRPTTSAKARGWTW